MSEISLLDNMVEEHGMNVYLCTHSSRHTPKGESVSDVLYNSWDQFVVRGIANKEFGMSYSDIEDWGPVECRRFYQENLLKPSGDLKECFLSHITTDNRALGTQLSSFSDYVGKVWQWRFREGYAFLNYRSRVDTYLARQIGEKAKEGQAIVKDMNRYLASIESLRGEANKVIHSNVATDRLKKLINHVVENLKPADLVELDLLDDDKGGE